MNRCTDCNVGITLKAIRCRKCNNLTIGNNRRGSNNPGWLGGKRVTTQGYVILRIDGKDIREHRHVMGQFIGRELLSCENVHHKNGNRQDNRIENLEVWVTQQPKGQRVEDLVVYAQEILARYS